MRRSLPWMLILLLLVPAMATAKKGKDPAGGTVVEEGSGEPGATPTVEELVGAISMALGGAKGGHTALAALPGYRLTYRMEVHDLQAGRDYTADHVYEKGLDGSVRLEVTIVSGAGVNSVAYAGAEEAWLEVDGQKTEFQPDEVLSRIADFAPDRLFQVPLDLGPRGLDSFPAQVRGRLAVEASATEEPAEGDETGEEEDKESAAAPLIVRAVDDEGVEQVRIVVDPVSSLPGEASFASIAGVIGYQFGDYRPVSEGLVLPFERRFYRNGLLLSDLKVSSFEVLGAEDAAEEGESGPAKGARKK